jgi:hypothetical protein
LCWTKCPSPNNLFSTQNLGLYKLAYFIAHHQTLPNFKWPLCAHMIKHTPMAKQKSHILVQKLLILQNTIVHNCVFHNRQKVVHSWDFAPSKISSPCTIWVLLIGECLLRGELTLFLKFWTWKNISTKMSKIRWNKNYKLLDIL